MATFGRELLDNVGGSIQLTADGRPEFKAGGITFDWEKVDAVTGTDVTYEDGVLVRVGEKAVRYGQVVTLIGEAEVQTATWTGGPTAGSAIVTLPADGAFPAESTTGIAFNATAAAFQAALEALSRIGPNGASVARAGAGSAGDPYVYTITFARRLGNVPQLTATHTFTGGTTPTATMATTTAGVGTGKYGPYDSAATDGRQTLTRGNCFLVNHTVKELDAKSDHPPVLDGGRVFKDRIIATTGTASLADGPTFTNLEAAFPRLSYVAD